MKHITFYFILIVLLNLSCKCFNQNKGNNGSEIENILKPLSIPLVFNKDTKVYSLNYNKFPFIQSNDFKSLSDSIYNLYFRPCDTNCLKHYQFSKDIHSLNKLQNKISVNDIRKYFGEESLKGTSNNKVTTLFYFFNSISNSDCFFDIKSLSPFDKCNAIVFTFDSDQVLKDVIVDTFSYY